MRNSPIVAVVDDDEAVREALCDLLQVSGLQCRTFERAADFLEQHEAEGFDCLVTDIRMPEMSGIDLLEQLQASQNGVPALILTSVQDEQAKARALALGARCWLTKPVADSLLLLELRRAMAGRS